MSDQHDKPFLQTVVCAAGVAADVSRLITAAQERHWAAGISDTLALGILCEAPAMGVPVAVLPYLNSAQAAHPAFRRSLELLREMGVLVGSYEPHRPKTGGGANRYRWDEVLELLGPGVPDRS
ncbi:hypothetical protein ACFV1R_35225 [Streptomyces coelicoflavus]|uniref:hypothetical protein n=1 Tax=Streptomyces coelicoflavus TaxID=285562 RepID=UPI00369ECFDB